MVVPLPFLGDGSHKAMIKFMTELPSHITKPDAIIVISAHWEENAVTVLGSPNPVMLYDYYGFPDEAYSLTYPALGIQTCDENHSDSETKRNWRTD